jgi:three-Cys-motif partner protein
MVDDLNASKDTASHEFGGGWTVLKLEALKRYLPAFTTALSKRNFKLFYIDGFAGTGQCDISINGERKTVDGSAKIALEVVPPFNEYWFIEKSDKNAQALNSLAAASNNKKIEILLEDANTALRGFCQRHDWRNTRAVLFLDPYGMQVEWQTLDIVAKTGGIDLWYLFPLSGLYRQMSIKADNIDNDKRNAISRCLGTDDWLNKFYSVPPQQNLFETPSMIREQGKTDGLLKYISDRLKTLFPSVSEPKILYQNEGGDSPGAPLFALYFAVSNPSPSAQKVARPIADYILNSL